MFILSSDVIEYLRGRVETSCYVFGCFFAKVPSGFVSPLCVSQLFLIDYLSYELFVNAKDIPFDNPMTRKKLLTLVSKFNKLLILYQSGCRASFDNDICGFF